MATPTTQDDLDDIRRKYPITALEREFIEWLVTPEPERQPKFAKDWAAEHGVSEKAPQRWKREFWFRKALDMRYQQLNISPDRVQRIVDAMQRKAEGGDVQAAKVMFGYLSELMPKERHEQPRDAQSLSDADLAAELEKAAQELRGPVRASEAV